MQPSASVRLTTQLTSLLRRELHPHQLLPNLTAGLLCGFIEVTFAASLASLIFALTLPDQISAGIGLGLVTVTIVSAVIALTSSCPGAIAIPQEVPAVIIALMVSTIVTQMPPGSSSEDTLMTVSTAIAFTTPLYHPTTTPKRWLLANSKADLQKGHCDRTKF